MNEKNTLNKSSQEPLETKRQKACFRPNHLFMEPDELRPEERWDRIVELLSLMALPETSVLPESAKEVLIGERSTGI